MIRIELAPHAGWVLRNRHRLGAKYGVDGGVPPIGLYGEPVDRLPNDRGEGYPLALRVLGHLPISTIV